MQGKGIKTTGEFREYLADVLRAVRAEEIGVNQATQIAKLAAQVNESFYAEVLASQRTKAPVTDFGNMPLGKHSGK